MKIEKAKRNTLRIMLQSFVYYLNEVLIEDFDEDELENIANTVFNVMTNSLDPEAAYIWNDEIFKIIEKQYKYKDVVKNNMNKIYKDIGWDDN